MDPMQPPPYAFGDTLYVFALSGLRLRAFDGSVAGLIPYGSQIIVEGYRVNERQDTIENIPGYWPQTTWKGVRGYVFDGFLSWLPPPETDIKDIASYAERYFKRVGDCRNYIYKGTEIELNFLESSENAEAYSYQITMTFKWSDLDEKDMYLLMRALFRDEIKSSLAEFKKEDTLWYEDENHTKKAGQDFFRFARGKKAGSYEAPVGFFLDYGNCFLGAYIAFGFAD